MPIQTVQKNTAYLKKAKGWTQTQMAEILGVSGSMVGVMVRNGTNT